MNNNNQNNNKNGGRFAKIAHINKFRVFRSFKWDENTSQLREFKKHNIFYAKNGEGKTSLSTLFKSIQEGNVGHLDFSVILDNDNVVSSEKFTNEDGAVKNLRVFNSDTVLKMIRSVETGGEFIHILGEEAVRASKEKDLCKETLQQLNITIATHIRILDMLQDMDNELYLKASKDIQVELGHDERYSATRIRQELAGVNPSRLKEVSVKMKATIKIKKEVAYVKLSKVYTSYYLMSMCFIASDLLVKKITPVQKKMFLEDMTRAMRFISNCRRIIKKVKFPDENASLFYDDIAGTISPIIKDGVKAKKNSLMWLDRLQESLNKKKKSHWLEMKLPDSIDVYEVANNLQYHVHSVNQLIDSHNIGIMLLSRDEKYTVNKVAADIMHKIQDDVRLNQHDIKSEHTFIKDAQLKIIEMNEKISTLAPPTANCATAQSLTKDLSFHLGHNELQFHVADMPDGYVVRRGTESAVDLSEGERNAVALLCFLKQVDDVKNCVMVIDDPVSSMDSLAMLSAISRIIDAATKSHQSFILTHNFDFLREIKVRLNRGKKNLIECYCIGTTIGKDKKRNAEIKLMPELIKNYNTEYVSYFKEVSKMSLADNNEPMEANFYALNIARKLLEMFVKQVCISNKNINIWDALEKSGPIDESYRHWLKPLLNKFSHGDGMDTEDLSPLLSDIPKVMKSVLSIMEKVNKQHYDCLCNAIKEKK